MTEETKTQKLTIEELNIRDLTYILANLRDDDQKELDALFPDNVAADIRTIITAGYCMQGYAYVAKIYDQPVCAFGVSVNGTVGSGWAFGTNRLWRVIPGVSHFCWNHISHQLVNAYLNRLEVRPMAGHRTAIAWLKKLGFKHDCTLDMYGNNGQDFELFSMTTKDYLAKQGKPTRKDLH